MSGGVEGEAKAGFLSLPVELVDSFVLPHLEWNDLLRFRRICKWTKEITSNYLKLHPELAPEIQIDEEGDKSLSAFLKLNIPTTRVFLTNLSGDEFYETIGKDGKKFLEQFGPHVKHLRVAQVSRYMYGEERKFLDSLTSLETFEAGHFGYGRKPRNVRAMTISRVVAKKKELMVKDPGSDGGVRWYPLIFKQLKTLKIYHDENIVSVRDYCLDYKRVLVDSINVGEALENIMLPMTLDYVLFPYPGAGAGFAKTLLFFSTSHFATSISKWEAAHQWKIIDFGGFYGPKQEGFRRFNTDRRLNQSSVFLDLCELCEENNIKLLNVHSWWFRSRIHFREQASPLLGIPVVSLINLHPWMLHLDMENLEKLEIRRTSQCSPGNNWILYRREWPALKVMDITVNSKQGHYLVREGWRHYVRKTTTTVSLFQFLFQDIIRQSMEELRLNFKQGGREPFVPRVEDIVAACPNLKKLTLIKWPGGNEDLVKFWEGLGNLEELHLELCQGLDDSAFLGEDETTPAFLKLTKLKSLALKQLDLMPQITDKVFTSVIRQMSLKRLILTSDQPLESVTLRGVQSLLNGRFADSIEKFPFQDWSLEGVSKKKFRKLETEFRSYQML